jgi:hypothetical protein
MENFEPWKFAVGLLFGGAIGIFIILPICSRMKWWPGNRPS